MSVIYASAPPAINGSNLWANPDLNLLFFPESTQNYWESTPQFMSFGNPDGQPISVGKKIPIMTVPSLGLEIRLKRIDMTVTKSGSWSASPNNTFDWRIDYKKAGDPITTIFNSAGGGAGVDFGTNNTEVAIAKTLGIDINETSGDLALQLVESGNGSGLAYFSGTLVFAFIAPAAGV